MALPVIDVPPARRSFLRPLAVAAFVGAMLALTAAGAEAQNTHSVSGRFQSRNSIDLPSLAPLVQRVMPAIVNVSAQLTPEAAANISAQPGNGGQSNQQAVPYNQLLRRFFRNFQTPFPRFGINPHAQKVMALGSGFIIDPSGYIVTNNHVVANAQKITVIFQDHSRHRAKVVGRDPLTDLALLKIQASHPLPYVEWGNSEKAQVGDWVVAVGNPFGLGGTVTAGIISALGRDISETDYEDFLQIDAPINRGNSGGPTFNLAGKVIGINTAIFSPSGGSVGIGFAIPSGVAEHVLEQLKTTGHAEHGWLGVSIQNVTPEIARGFALKPGHQTGALVASVVPHSPAARAELKPGDIIIAVNGQPVRVAHDLRRIVGDANIGQKLDITVERNGREQKLAATVGKLPTSRETASLQGSSGNAGNASTVLDLRLAPLTPALRQRLQIAHGINGVVVEAVSDDSPAASIGIEPGDVIMSVNQKPVRTPRQAAMQIKEAARKGQILLLVEHRGTTEFLALSTGAPGAAGSHPG